jgi:hypothetical protein
MEFPALTAASRETQMPSTTPRSRTPDALPYRIELWDGAADERRILARAISAQLARAIFRAASDEHPESRILLRRGNRIVADSDAKTASVRAEK